MAGGNGAAAIWELRAQQSRWSQGVWRGALCPLLAALSPPVASVMLPPWMDQGLSEAFPDAPCFPITLNTLVSALRSLSQQQDLPVPCLSLPVRPDPTVAPCFFAMTNSLFPFTLYFFKDRALNSRGSESLWSLRCGFPSIIALGNPSGDIAGGSVAPPAVPGAVCPAVGSWDGHRGPTPPLVPSLCGTLSHCPPPSTVTPRSAAPSQSC